MKRVALLRGVMPTGKNRIPKMSYLVEILEAVNLKNVKTHIQSGNIIFDSDLPDEAVSILIHQTILEKIGADLKVIVKKIEDLKRSIADNPFDASHDYSRVHLVFTNDTIDEKAIEKLESIDFDLDKFVVGEDCLYLYLILDSSKRKLYTNYLEKQLSVVATTRKINVIEKLIELSCE